MRIFKIFFLLIFTLSYALAQDAHFTQYYQTPAYLNPSLVGNYNGLYKVGINYRDQWRAALDRPYSTFAANGESKFYLGNKDDVFALGILFYSDRISNFNLNTSQIALTGSFHKMLNRKKKEYLGIGYQISIIQKNLNYENLTFGDQFNAIDGYTNATQELLPVNNIGFFDMGIGADYSVSPSKNSQFNIGLAMFHIGKPNISFYAREDQPDEELDLEAFLDRKITAHISYSTATSASFFTEPRAMIAIQDKHREIVLANIFKYKKPDGEGRTFYFGPGIRMSNQLDKLGMESIFAIVGFEYNGLNLGLSYDHNTSDIFNDRLGFGSFEFTINYYGEFENADAFCPTF